MLLTDTKGNIVGKTAENKNIQHLVDYLETHINDQSILNKLDFFHKTELLFNRGSRECPKILVQLF